jgi:hypothetical protein
MLLFEDHLLGVLFTTKILLAGDHSVTQDSPDRVHAAV